MKKDNRDSFVFYASFWKAIREVPREIQGEVLTAIIEYGLTGVTTENLKPIAKAMFILIKPQIDANYKKYENGKNGAEYGKLGGRPKKENPNKTPKKPLENPKKTPNVNVNENVNENENVNGGDFVVFENLSYPKTHMVHSGTFIKNQNATETFAMQNKLKSIDEVRHALMDFLKHLNIEDKTYDKGEFKDFKTHFLNWYRRVPKREKSVKSKELPEGMQPAEWLS